MPFQKYQRVFIFLIPTIIVGVLLYYFSDLFTYFTLGWVISLVGAPIYKFINKFLGSNISAILSLGIITFIFSIFMWLLVPTIVQQTQNLARIDYEEVMANLNEPLEDWNNWLVEKGFTHLQREHTHSAFDSIHFNEYREDFEVLKIDTSHGMQINVFINLEEDNKKDAEQNAIDFQDTQHFVDSIKERLFAYFNPAAIPALFGKVAGFFGNLLITILSAFFIAFFFLKEAGLFTRILKAAIPDDQEEKLDHSVQESEDLLGRYFIGVTIQITIITILMSIALRVLGFQNALLIAFLAGLMNMVPYIGPFLGAMFGIFITISSNIDSSFYDTTLPSIYLLIIVFGVMQLVDNFIIQPNVFSRSVKAHPLEIFSVILIGAKLGGIMGMIIAIPAYTISRVVAKSFLSEFKIVKSITSTI